MKPEKDLSTLAAQVTELEEKLSFQQRTLEELNEVVLAQQTEIERLGRELSNYRKLTEELLERNPGEDLPHEKPPHY
ncbi:MAG: SlyX family protein [Pirellulales bacterium]|nr:SlyX family protein [Pirellulales bacterium]|tara:strand:+ start:228 stop:458 length:231 start_codon:yes stop_codon:yes gene_type:complete